MENGHEAGNQNESKEQASLDPASAFIVIDAQGWLTARINVQRGFYAVLGFLREVEDKLRQYFANLKKQEEEKANLIKPGFRGFNPFKRGK